MNQPHQPPMMETYAQLLGAIERISGKWAREAHEIDQDGDFCCAQTRRNDAGELADLIRRCVPAPAPTAPVTVTGEGTPGEGVVCEHGTAMDVHCCNCHSGFLFDLEECVCGPVVLRVEYEFDSPPTKAEIGAFMDRLPSGYVRPHINPPNTCTECAEWERRSDHAKRQKIKAEQRLRDAQAPGEGWQPIETAPKEPRAIIGKTRDGHVHPVWWNHTYPRWEWCCDGYHSGAAPRLTHWMPLPEPPK